MFTQDQIDNFVAESQSNLGSGIEEFHAELSAVYPGVNLYKNPTFMTSSFDVEVLTIRDRMIGWINWETKKWHLARRDTIQSRMHKLLLEFNDLPMVADEASRPQNFDLNNKQHTDQFVVNLCCSFSRIVALRELLVDSGLRVYPELDHDSDADIH